MSTTPHYEAAAAAAAGGVVAFVCLVPSGLAEPSPAGHIPGSGGPGESNLPTPPRRGTAGQGSAPHAHPYIIKGTHCILP